MPAHRRTQLSIFVVACALCVHWNDGPFWECLLSVQSAILIAIYVAWRKAYLVGGRRICTTQITKPTKNHQLIHHRVRDQNVSGLDKYDFIRGGSGLDYGSGMALSYYHGYLKLVLPSQGDYHSKSIVERMEDYEASRHVRFPVKKLFILVPESMYTPNTLDAKTLQVQTPLEKLLLNRAGSFKREYHNSVYKIEATDNWYVVTEGATPLKTFQEALSTAAAGHLKLERYRTAIVSSFVCHLKELLFKDLDCRDLCEVVQFADRNVDGTLVDYGQVLREAIEKVLLNEK